MYFFWGGYGEFESAEVNRAFSLIEIKIKSIFQIEQDPSMSLRDYNYSNAVAGMGDSLGVGSGVMAWKEFTPWIENTYRVILLEMGYLGVFVFFMFLLEGVIYSAKRIVLMNACRQMGYFFLWFYLSLAGYALTLDVFHPFTLSFCIGFVLALRYSYSKSKYLSIKQNECALSARCA